MNIETSLKKILQGLKRGKGAQMCTPALANPSRDWQALLLGTAVLFLTFAFFAGVTYFSVTSRPDTVRENAGPSLQVKVLDEPQLELVLHARDERAAKRVQYTQ